VDSTNLDFIENNKLVNEFYKVQKELENKKFYAEEKVSSTNKNGNLYVKELQFIANSLMFVFFCILIVFALK